MEWVKAEYPDARDLFMDGKRLGETNKLLVGGQPGTYFFHLGEPVDYKPKRMKRRLQNTSRSRPLVLVFERRNDGDPDE